MCIVLEVGSNKFKELFAIHLDAIQVIIIEQL
jgi:hypothetical protein